MVGGGLKKKRVRWKDSQPTGSLFTYIYVDKHIGREMLFTGEEGQADGEIEQEEVNPHTMSTHTNKTSSEYRQFGKEKNVKALLGKKLPSEEEE
jgi:hypothetical protein